MFDNALVALLLTLELKFPSPEDVPLLPSFEPDVESEEPLLEPVPEEKPLSEPEPLPEPELPEEEPPSSLEEGTYFSTVSFR